jgi:hypothetical protein
MRKSIGFRALLAGHGLLLALLIGSPNRTYAQLAGSGTITGSVTDPSGAVVPGADVTIRNTDTGIEHKVQTTDAGVYTGSFIQPGHYEVEVRKAGFAGSMHKDLQLQVGQTLTVNVSLSVQAAQQEVTVTVSPSVVDVQKTDVSQVVTDTEMGNLPLSGRRWDTFALSTPNVTNDGSSGMASYRGISGLYNSNNVDGANNNQALFSEQRGRATSGAYVFSMDSIMEYQVSVSNYSAELGQAAGGVVNAVTKSGTNDIHGDLFYYLRYPTWNALDPLPKSQGNFTQPIHQWQQFGTSVGGPIIKDRLFFFGTYDGSRKVNPIAYTSSTFNATTKALPCPAQVTATQCSNANAFLDGLLGTYPRATNQDVLFGKLDGRVNERNHVASSFDWMDYNAPNAYQTAPSYNNSSIGANGSYIYHERVFVTNWDSTITPTMVNNVRFQWGRDLETAGANGTAPYVSLASDSVYGENYALPRTAEPDEHRIQIADTLSVSRGRHTIKTGIDLNIIHEVMINLYNGTGQYSYTGSGPAAFDSWVLDVFGINAGDGLTGKHWASFTQVDDPVTHVGKDDFWEKDVSAFVEDNWKANSRLTLNMGLRYDIFEIPQPPMPNTLTPLTTYYSSTINIPKGQLAPRFGLAYQLTPKTVVRTGYGMFYAKTSNSTYYATRVENGVIQQTFNCAVSTCPSLSFPNVIFNPPGPAMVAPFAGALTPQVVPFTPPSASQVTRGMSPNWVDPVVHEGNVTVEQQLPGGLAASVSYVVSRGLRLPIFYDANLAPSTTTKTYDILNAAGQTAQTATFPFYTTRLNPTTGEVFIGQSDVNSWYNSMVISLRRPMRHGLEFEAYYTLAKSFDGAQVAGSNGTFNGTDYPIDPYNRKQEYALSDLDQHQHFVTSAVWMPNFGTGLSKPAKLVVNGWVFSTIVTESTGLPVTPYTSGYVSGGPDGGVTGGVSYAGATSGRAGWLGRNSYTGPGYNGVDFRLARTFPIGERVKLALQGEAFNLFNHTNVVSVNTTAFNFTAAGSGACNGHTNNCYAPNAAFLAPTATSSLLSGPRQLQVSARLTF